MKTKKQRQNWWNSLTAEEQTAYIEQRQEKKAQKRRRKDLNSTKAYGNCCDCFHHKTNSCTDILPNGCKDYFSPKK